MMLKTAQKYPITPEFVVKCATGSTNVFKVHIMQALIENGFADSRTRAAQMIAEGQYSLNAISNRFGFCDQFYFSRRFRQWAGKTPSQYRKEEKYNQVN